MLDTDARAKLRSLLPQVLARRLNEAGGELGTTAYCLHVYLLQKLYLVPLGYRFKLYPEGPSATKSWATLTWPSPGTRYRLTTYRKMAPYASQATGPWPRNCMWP